MGQSARAVDSLQVSTVRRHSFRHATLHAWDATLV
jgi:hypothetical protein